MYSSEDFEQLFIRYKGEAYPRGESIQTFCHRNNVPYNQFEKWYKDTRHRVVEVAVDGRPSTMEEEKPTEAVPCILGDNREGCAHPVGLAHKQRASFTAGKLKLRGIEAPRGETGGSMLSVSGPDRFYYLRNFHDLRCKYARVLSVIRQQMNREPQAGEAYIMMSKDHHTVRLYSYDKRSFRLYEQRFDKDYTFMKVSCQDDREVFSKMNLSLYITV